MLSHFKLTTSLFLMFFSSTEAYGQKDVEQLLRRFCELKNAGSVSCDYRPSFDPSHAGTHWSEFLANQNCTSLFSTTAPAWVESNPEARALKDPHNWQPVCSAYRVEFIRKQNPELTENQILIQANAYMHSSDACENSRADRYNEVFQNPSQMDRNVKVMSPAQRALTFDDFKNVQERIVGSCCGQDALCSNTMKKVEVRMCSAQSDPKKPDACIENGVYYMSEFDPRWAAYIRKGFTPAQWRPILGDFELKPGTITISPFVGMNSKSDFVHELAHACSRIQKKLAIYRGSPEELAEYKSMESCEINENSLVTYARMHRRLGMNAATTDCFYHRATEATQARFKAGVCEGGCKRSALEEGTAETFRLLSLPEHEWVPGVLPAVMCNFARDSKHMLVDDVIQCMLKSPSVVQRFEKATSCKK